MGITSKNHHKPLFAIGIIADMIGVTQTTLRIWEKKGLVKPQRLGKNRYYSYNDLDQLKDIHRLLHEEGMNIAGVNAILNRTECWEIKKCGEMKETCQVYLAQKDY